MAASFFFYDLETSGIDARTARIMQFAGQRTDMDLNPIGDPVNLTIKLTPDVLPEPDAIMITGITPQQTLIDGLTEAEFLKFFYDEVVQPDTIFLGFNTVRFDDEFMRYLHYRNFYDAYEWQWKDGCSRWDILDMVRMMRALRPEGINWPFASNGKPTNRLELLTSLNKLDHTKAHDALNDVYATIAVAKMVYEKQPELFKYLLKMRNKKEVANLIDLGKPFVYTSGRYASENLCTSIAVRLAPHPQSDSALVYDLRHDPTPFLKMSPDELVAAWRWSKDPEALRLPVKTVKYNRVPAVAPLGVIKDDETKKRLGLDIKAIEKHRQMLLDHPEFVEHVLKALNKMDEDRARKQAQASMIDNHLTVDSRLYDGFIGDADKNTMRAVRVAKPEALTDMTSDFHDPRLRSLLPLYKARNFPHSLTNAERVEWDTFCRQKLFDGGDQSRFAKYFQRLGELANSNPAPSKMYILEELQLYGQSILPADVSD